MSSVPVGLYRSYARLGSGEELTYDGWCRAVRAGRTFPVRWPTSLALGRRQPAGRHGRAVRSGSVTVYSNARSVFPLRSLEIVRNGELVAVEEAHGRRELSLSESLRVDGSTWFAARTFGTDNQLDVWGRKVFAHTSPVYVAWWAVGHGRSGRAPLHPHVRRGRP
jgi:hypothetical protein